jgi:enamine deaminase RidA (YjgF/YER057c/UK114 family)
VSKRPRKNFSSGAPLEPVVGYSRAVKIGDRVLVAGTAAIWPDGSVNLEPAAQAKRCLEIIIEALAQAGAEPEHVVRTRMYITDRSYADVVGKVHGAVFAKIPAGVDDGGRGGTAGPPLEGRDRSRGRDPRLTLVCVAQ